MASFVKSHGLGNDYIVLDADRITFPLDEAAIRRICDRHFGVGSDGILLVCPSSVADFRVRIFNPDGSEAEKSGNGLRIAAHYLYTHGYVREPRFTIETAGGIVRVELDLEGGVIRQVAVAMGGVSFRSSDIPMSGPDREVVDEPLEVAGETLRVTALTIGNPHCVVVVDRLEAVDFDRLGPALETHPAFPRRTNVQFAQVLDRRRLRIRIWERGAGHTLASGSSACAAAAACHRLGRVDDAVTVEMEGGVLSVDIGREGLMLRGPVEEICRGTLSPDLLRHLEPSSR